VTRLTAARLSKSYGPVRVLHGLDLEIAGGEIHALVGENGAGKSTFIKILSGAVAADEGDVRLDGVPMPSGDPLAVRDLGISTVHQEFTLVRELSVADNVFLGRERGRFLLRSAEMRRAVRALLDSLGVHIDPSAAAGSLSVAHQQMVEIARALSTDARVLILDEPSATLSDVEVEILFGVLRQLRAQGLAILYVSHRLDEIFALADRVTVLRDGRLVETAPVASWNRQTLIRAMVGRDVAEEYPSRSPLFGRPVLELEHLASPPRFTDVSLSVRQGEIVGLAGLVGAGRTSVALAVIGALDVTAARDALRLDGRPARFASPADAIAAGVTYVTEDRKQHGMFLRMGTGENMTIAYLSSFASAGVLSIARERAAAATAAKRFDVRSANLAQPAGTLSGGNQQKALLARFVLQPLQPPKVLIIDEPTRGVDVGARVEIYRIMNELTAGGMGILMISSDLPEVLGMADRVVVMREGRTTGELPRLEATAERVMALAAAHA
jgi:ABC-type sugar transport system ATPase subunit